MLNNLLLKGIVPFWLFLGLTYRYSHLYNPAMLHKMLPALLVGIIVGVALNTVTDWFLSTNPQPEIVWLIIANVIPILGSFSAFIAVLSSSRKL